MEVTIIGAGYVGLATGVGLARTGHRITFVERRDDRRTALASGHMPIEEPGLREAFQAAHDRIGIVGSVAEAGVGDLVLVAVGTPIGEAGRSDLSQLEAAMGSLASYPDAHICVRSTLPPGLSRRLPALLGREDGSRLSTNPEFLRQGEAMHDVAAPSRIVFGVFPETGQEHRHRLDLMYAGVPGPRITVDVSAAELIKNVANAFLALKLSFVNEVAALAEEYDVEVEEVLQGIQLDPRIGGSYMKPGLGFGGSCLPKELEVVAIAGRRKGLAMHVARATSIANAEQQARFASRILRDLGAGSHQVGLLGLSFKAGTDDVRGSPSLTIARELLDAGMHVVAHDPVVSPSAAEAAAPGIVVVSRPVEAAAGSDAIIIGTEWPIYALLEWAELAKVMRQRVVYDGRNILDPEAVTLAGLAYRGVGRRPRAPVG